MKNISLKLLALLIMISTYSYAQDAEQLTDEDLYALSLEELMNVPIKSASKKEETLFDAPLSSYTITRSDIDRAGSTSIMEALRLAPGVIVREQSNGVYDIHIRGMEDLTRSNGTFLKANAYTLIMIDNRPVFNHGLGGTFWESLPVDINDVDRIEIVRGPSSPLFGPNAVTGVINIITKRMGKSNMLINGNVQAGTSGTSIANASVGKTSGKFSAIVSANVQDRQRFQSDYYNSTTGTYVPLDTLVKDPAAKNSRYPNSSRSLNKWGVNGYFTYKPSEKVSIDLTLSTQAATSQRVFTTNPLQYTQTNNTAANLAVTAHALKIRTSYLKGYNADNKNSIPNGEYDFNVSDASAEYDFKLGKGQRYTITPGVSYQNVQFNDLKYYAPLEGKVGYFNNDVSINTTAGFVRSDLNFTNKFRTIAALRVDKFSVPDKAYLAYEFAATYKVTSKNLLRIAVTRSNSGSFIGYNYLNIGGQQTGNKDLKIFTLDMVEAGYRAQLTSHLQLDIDVFRQHASNLTALVATALAAQPPSQFRNTPTTATQIGTTISINFVPNEKIQFKPFITLQQTQTKDLPSSYLDPTLAVPPALTVTYSNSAHNYTPGAYGGFYLNYQPVSKLSINLNSYFYGNQTQYDQSWTNATLTPNQYAQGQISSKFLLSAKVSYEVVKGLNVFVNARNLVGSNSIEFYAADKTKALYLAGASFNLNGR